MSRTALAVVAMTAATSLLGTGALASAATKPVVSKQTTSALTRAPLTIPGTGVKKGARLPRGDRLISRTVTLDKGQKVEFKVLAPRGMTLRCVVPGGNAVSFTVVRPVHYAGRRAVTVRAFVASSAKAGMHTERIWALVR